jgi:hypothetical protein
MAAPRATNAQGQPSDGAIHWLFNHDLRGQSPTQAHVKLGSHWQRAKFARVLTPDPSSSEKIVVSLIGKHGHNICMTVVNKNHALGGGCGVGNNLTPFSEMNMSSGRGRQQIQIVAGLASDDVARMALLLPDGRHVPVPLKDNAFVFTIKAAYISSTLVAYDKNGLVISGAKQRPIPRLPG